MALAVNAELTQLYWHIGRRIGAELLQGQRGQYGKQVVAALARQLTADFGKGWIEQQLRHCLRLAEVFSDGEILSTVWRELSWSHLKALIYIDAPLKRDFYLEICRVERWSVRQLQERINALLFERTSPCCHRARRCKPSCTSTLRLPARSCKLMLKNKTWLVAQPAAQVHRKNMLNTHLAHAQSAQAATESIANNTISPIYVTQPPLPPLHEFIPYLEAIWASKVLTNSGPFHQQLEQALCDYLGKLFERAGLELLSSSQIWVHETPAEPAQRALWRKRAGRAYTGRWPVALAKHVVFATATAIRSFARCSFAINVLTTAYRRSR